MGYYINPTDMTKEEFLEKHGKKLNEPPMQHKFEGQIAVCLINNFQFTSAGICYCQEELEEFSRPDIRPRKWFMVPEKELEPYLPEHARNM